jgi:hypothetical protein
MMDDWGRIRGKTWEHLSKNKAPGVDNMLDSSIYRSPERKLDVTIRILQNFNEGIYLTEVERTGKLMMLSKQPGQEIIDDLTKARPITISNVVVKLTEVALLHVINHNL